MSLVVNKDGIKLNNKKLDVFDRALPQIYRKKEKVSNPNKKDNNKEWRDFLQTVKNAPEYKGWTYQKILVEASRLYHMNSDEESEDEE